jgi:uncharacterized protein (TIGR02001 family)
MTIRPATAALLGTALCAFAMPPAAYADETIPTVVPATTPAPAPPPISVSATLTGSTDYMFRGISQTNQNPAVFAEIDLASHGFYLGGRTENVKFAGIRQEYDGWGGYILPLGALKLDVGFLRYGYTNAVLDTDTLEGKAALSGKLGKLSAYVAGYFTGNYFGSHHGGEYYEVGATYPLLPKLAVVGVFGHQNVDHDFHYDTWNLGLSYALRKGMLITARYVDSNDTSAGSLGRARAVGSFAITF